MSIKSKQRYQKCVCYLIPLTVVKLLVRRLTSALMMTVACDTGFAENNILCGLLCVREVRGDVMTHVYIR